MRTCFISAAALSLLLIASVVWGADETKPTTDTGPTEYSGKTLKQWIEEINPTKNRDPGLRHRAILAVTLFDRETASKEAGAALIDAINDNDTSIRVNALVAMAVLGVHESHVRAALPELIRQVETDRQDIVRLHAAIVLGRMDFAGRPALAALVNRCRDTNSYEIRKQAVIAVARVGAADDKNPMDMRAVTALINVLVPGGVGINPDRSAEVRLAAVSALGDMGIPPTLKEKNQLVAGLKAAQNDPHKIIQIWASVSLMKIDGVSEKDLASILVHLKGKDQLVRVEAIRALGAVGPKAMKLCYESIFELLSDKDLGLVANAAWALGEWGDAADAALPTLQKLHDSKDMDERIKYVIKEAIDKVQGKKPKN